MLDVQPQEGSLNFGSFAKLNVAVLGAGTVGGGVIRLIRDRSATSPVPFEIKWVGVRNLSKPRGLSVPEHLMSSDLNHIVEDPEVDIVVEALGGLEPARSCIERALRAGKHVVTANKFVVSEWGEQLHDLATGRGCYFLYEASVAGSIPIIEILRREAIPDRIVGVYAILNGTTNFALTRMTDYGEDLQSALKKAQQMGFSEADPSFDVSGKDAGQKLSIIISLLKKQHCHPAQIDIRGIECLAPLDFQFAAQSNWVIKPLATYEEAGEAGFAAVEPVLVSRTSVLASTRDEYNALCFDCQNIGMQVLIGKGAGELPTASAVFSDLVRIAQSSAKPRIRHVDRTPSGLTLFRSSLDNPKYYRFYISCLPKMSEKRRKIYEVFEPDCELIQEQQISENAFRFSVVTKPIQHAELFRLLDLVLTLDPDVGITWLRILEGI